VSGAVRCEQSHVRQLLATETDAPAHGSAPRARSRSRALRQLPAPGSRARPRAPVRGCAVAGPQLARRPPHSPPGARQALGPRRQHQVQSSRKKSVQLSRSQYPCGGPAVRAPADRPFAHAQQRLPRLSKAARRSPRAASHAAAQCARQRAAPGTVRGARRCALADHTAPLALATMPCSAWHPGRTGCPAAVGTLPRRAPLTCSSMHTLSRFALQTRTFQHSPCRRQTWSYIN